MKIINKSIAILCGISVLSSCSDEWLEPKPLSFYEPSNTYTTAEGLEAALLTTERQLRYYYLCDWNAMFGDEMRFSDVAVSVISDCSGAQDLNTYVTPTANLANIAATYLAQFWTFGYQGISFANSVISSLPSLEMDETLKGQMLSRAYFQRAFRYYHLLFQFGDIPFISKEVTSPEIQIRSAKMDLIIEQMIEDMEYAVSHSSLKDLYGKESKGACRMLLMKYYMAHRDFDKAIAQADTLINNLDGSDYALMEESFGQFEPAHDESVYPIQRNVIWDLHRGANKYSNQNKEVIYLLTNVYSSTESDSWLPSMLLRNYTPYWSQGGTFGILTPNGKEGMQRGQSEETGYLDFREAVGRGEPFTRPTWWAEHSLWDDENDLRHSVETGNWFVMEKLKYNNIALKESDPDYYNQPIQKYDSNGTLLCQDTIRSWFGWPYYKLYSEHPNQNKVNGYTGSDYDGGPTGWYIFRLAETYLLRAEAYYWKGEYAKATEDVNKIRKRAKCTRLYDVVDLDDIYDERARELTYEEMRHVELVRTSYIKAHVEGTYTDPSSLVTAGNGSFWWHRICKYNNYYNSTDEKTITRHGDRYTISPYHIFWPIPQNEINAISNYGEIRQNYGYSGYDASVKVYQTHEELEESGM